MRHRDIGRIEPGLPAKLKIDAYPFQDFGVVPAKVASIAGDAVRDDEAGSAYKVTLAPERNTMLVRGKTVPLRSGLTLTADIVTDPNKFAWKRSPASMRFLANPAIRVNRLSIPPR